MVGLPACGKTTLSFIISDTLAVFNQNVTVIELDQIFRSMPQQKEIEGQWHQVRVQALDTATKQLQGNNTTIIIDDTNDYRSMRKPYFRLAQIRRVKYLEIHFKNFSYQDSMVRDAQRENSVGADTITNIAKRIEWTDVTEKNDWSIVFESFEQVLEKVRYNMKVPDPLPESENIIFQSQNQRHINDLKLRKCLKEILETNPKLKPYAKRLNEIRTDLMNEDIYDGNDHANEFLRVITKEFRYVMLEKSQSVK